MTQSGALPPLFAALRKDYSITSSAIEIMFGEIVSH
jgi:hypothetical protein